MVFGVVSSEGHIIPPHIGLKVNTKVYLDVLKSVVIPWCNQVAAGRPWAWQQDWRQPTSPKRPRLSFRRSATILYPSLTAPSSTDLNLLNYFVWSSVENITNMNSPTTSKPAWLPPSAEYSPSSRRRLWKRYSPSSGSVSRQWLRLKVATLNRCQLYYIIKLPELIFSIKVLK